MTHYVVQNSTKIRDLDALKHRWSVYIICLEIGDFVAGKAEICITLQADVTEEAWFNSNCARRVKARLLL